METAWFWSHTWPEWKEAAAFSNGFMTAQFYRENTASTPFLAWHQWLRPVILATWEAELKRIKVLVRGSLSK
jgi:hypothetical protein